MTDFEYLKVINQMAKWYEIHHVQDQGSGGTQICRTARNGRPYCSNDRLLVAQARVKISMMNLVYNMKRMVQLMKHDALATILGV
ncbi:MAG: hypothetical protein M1511_06800 [Deltaproteobacteria bacterium]|nr:hypothetical protein [Deltaproteobacteria bacterium]